MCRPALPGLPAALAGILLNEEWLALVHYHKAFHRDHIVHQAQEGIVVKKLLEQVSLSAVDHPLAKACRDAEWSGVRSSEELVTVQQLAAYVLALGDEGTTYLYSYARDLGVPEERLIPCTPACYWFWYPIIYNAAVTAALYHDIGYPVQFLQTVSRKIDDSRFTAIVRGGDPGRVYELFDDPLCLMPFRGYRSSRKIGLSHSARRGARRDRRCVAQDPWPAGRAHLPPPQPCGNGRPRWLLKSCREAGDELRGASHRHARHAGDLPRCAPG